MTFVVLDTDVASAILRERVPTSLNRQLTGRSLAIMFVTVGELTRWTLVRLGPQRMAGMRAFFAHVVVLPYSAKVATVWGEIQAHGLLRGRTRPANDAWIVACCLARELPLATLNLKDFSAFVEHEGLEIVPT